MYKALCGQKASVHIEEIPNEDTRVTLKQVKVINVHILINCVPIISTQIAKT